MTCPAGFSTRALPGGAPGDIQCFRLPCDKCPKAGNPVIVSTVGKQEREVDISVPAPGGLEFVRTFDSSSYFNNYGGVAPVTWDFWHHTYGRRILTLDTSPNVLAVAQREDGTIRHFGLNGHELANIDSGTAILQRLTDSADNLTGWRYTSADQEVELYNAAGQLLSITARTGLTRSMTYSDAATPSTLAPGPGYLLAVTDDFGRMLQLTHDSAGRLASVTGLVSAANPNGARYEYRYDAHGNLAQVTMPDLTVRTYFYENAAFPRLLTGIVDENNVRYASFTYDAQGYTQSSQHAGGTNLYQFSVATNLTAGTRTTVYVDPLGTTYTHQFALLGGALRNTSITRTCSGCTTATTTMTYDANGNVATRVDYQGNRTDTPYDLQRNLELRRTEGLTAAGASTSATRTITTQWHPVYRFPTAVAEPLRITSYTYDAAGNLLTKSIQATTDSTGSLGLAATLQGTPRTWTYAYTTFGRVETMDGPRTDVSDVTTYTYHPDNDSCSGCRGQVQTVRNALNQVTTYDSYDSDGRVTQLTDPNGVVSTLTYAPRGWLQSRTVNAGQPSAETTTYAYDGLGQLIQVTLPDNSFIAYTYDNAHRLVEVNDSLGNAIEYTLDAMGNRITESRYDPQDVLTQQRSMVYDQLNRLKQQLGGSNPLTDVTNFGYDQNGNRLSTQDALLNVTSQQYDARNRLTQVTDAAAGVVGYGYDQLDQLIRVTDPRGLVTQYGYDGLGNRHTLTSPDTGVTQYVYDAAGNLLTRTDALAQTTSHSYDALNRLQTQTVTNGPSYAFSYDQGAFGVGRLSGIAEGSAGGTQYSYDAFGRVTAKSQTLHGRTLTVGYGYAPGGKLNGITYPSGRVLSYGFDGAGRINRVSVDGTVLLDQVTWQPFGPPGGWTWGNGTTHQRSYDLDGRIKTLLLPPLPEAEQSFGYDHLYRLTAASTPARNLNLGYAYDATGNRTQETRNGASSLYTTEGNSNRLLGVTGAQPRQFTFNANGSIVSDSGAGLVFDGRERMIAAGATNYYVNALGQRIEKAGPGAETGSGVRQFVYDEAGHLLGEYDAVSGTAIAEHFYLQDWPVGVGVNNVLYYVHPDHLGTPRAVTRASDDAVVWRWESAQPFGGDVADENPGGLGEFRFNLRLPGQYFDGETGRHYNYFRDYDPSTGRYVESDPIGLKGGTNTYGYVAGRPLTQIDSLGLWCYCNSRWVYSWMGIDIFVDCVNLKRDGTLCTSKTHYFTLGISFPWNTFPDFDNVPYDPSDADRCRVRNFSVGSRIFQIVSVDEDCRPPGCSQPSQ